MFTYHVPPISPVLTNYNTSPVRPNPRIQGPVNVVNSSTPQHINTLLSKATTTLAHLITNDTGSPTFGTRSLDTPANRLPVNNKQNEVKILGNSSSFAQSNYGQVDDNKVMSRCTSNITDLKLTDGRYSTPIHDRNASLHQNTEDTPTLTGPNIDQKTVSRDPTGDSIRQLPNTLSPKREMKSPITPSVKIKSNLNNVVTSYADKLSARALSKLEESIRLLEDSPLTELETPPPAYYRGDSASSENLLRKKTPFSRHLRNRSFFGYEDKLRKVQSDKEIVKHDVTRVSTSRKERLTNVKIVKGKIPKSSASLKIESSSSPDKIAGTIVKCRKEENVKLRDALTTMQKVLKKRISLKKYKDEKINHKQEPREDLRMVHSSKPSTFIEHEWNFGSNNLLKKPDGTIGHIVRSSTGPVDIQPRTSSQRKKTTPKGSADRVEDRLISAGVDRAQKIKTLKFMKDSHEAKVSDVLSSMTHVNEYSRTLLRKEKDNGRDVKSNNSNNTNLDESPIDLNEPIYYRTPKILKKRHEKLEKQRQDKTLREEELTVRPPRINKSDVNREIQDLFDWEEIRQIRAIEREQMTVEYERQIISQNHTPHINKYNFSDKNAKIGRKTTNSYIQNNVYDRLYRAGQDLNDNRIKKINENVENFDKEFFRPVTNDSAMSSGAFNRLYRDAQRRQDQCLSPQQLVNVDQKKTRNFIDDICQKVLVSNEEFEAQIDDLLV